MDSCVFCKIISGELPANNVYEDDEVLAFHDLHPNAPVHVLVIPKKHISRLAEATKEDKELLGKLQLVAANIAKEAGIGDGFRVLNASGELAGQSVFHIHYHVIGGWDKDSIPEMESKKDFH